MKEKSTSKLAFFSLRVLPGLVATAFIAFALAPCDAAGDCGIPYTPTPTPPCTNHSTFTVNMCTPDNYELVTDVYLKSGQSTPMPVLVTRGDGARCFATYPANVGYDQVVQDTRPLIGPTPNQNFLFKADQDDGHFVLSQLADSISFPWGNGRLGMVGWSRAGIVDYLAAPGAVASLRGIQTHFATGDILNYGFFNGGVLHRETADALLYPEGTPWKDYVGLPIWNKYLITDGDASRANVAGLHRGGWFDVFGQGTLDSFSRLQTAVGPSKDRQKVVIGPWTHGGNGTPPPGDGYLTFPRGTTADANWSAYDDAWKNGVLYNNWTDWNNTNTLPAVKVYHMGAPSGTEWRSYTKWPPSPAQEFPLYFYHNGRPGPGNGSLLSGTPPPNSGQVAFTSNPSNPCPTLGGTNNLVSCAWPSPTPTPPTPPLSCGPYDQRPIEARDRSDVLVFTSSAGPAFIVGRIHADVWIKTVLRDVDVFVRMTDVFPDGHSMLMAQGIQRARYRNGVCPQLLDGSAQRVRVDLGSTALVLPALHKLRVIVSAAAGPPGFGSRPNEPLYSINPQNGDDEYLSVNPPNAVTGSINVLFGGTNASALYIPVPDPQATPPPDRRPPKPTPCPNEATAAHRSE